MGQPKDLGEVWSLVQRSPKFKVGDLVYLAAYLPKTQSMNPILVRVISAGVVDVEVKLVYGLAPEEMYNQPFNVPVWGTLGKTRVN